MVASVFLGRPLSQGEVVHHKNGDGSDNRKENLVVMSLGTHSAMHNIGSKRSQETKEKISAAAKGRIVSPETKAKISKTLMGRIITQEHRDKISIALKGRLRSVV